MTSDIDMMFLKFVKEGMTTSSRIEDSKNIGVNILTIPNGTTDYLKGEVTSGKNQYFPLIDSNGEHYCTCMDFITRKNICKHQLALLREYDLENSKELIKKCIQFKRFEEA